MAFRRLRYEGMDLGTQRIENLTDGMFAIIMTILVLNLSLPVVTGSGSDDLSERLIEMLPDVWAYALSFAVLAVVWMLHHYQFSFIRDTDSLLLWLNIIFLMFASLMPFSTMLLREPDQAVALRIYDTNIFLVLLALYAHWWYATRGCRLVDTSIEKRSVRLMKITLIAGMVFFAVGVALTFFDAGISGGFLSALGTLYVILTALGAHRVKQLAICKTD